MISKQYYEVVFERTPEENENIFKEDLIECLKYLAIMSMTKGRRIVVTPKLDDIWHELIVQTQQYSELCKKLPGKTFINHTSISPSEYEEIVGEKEFVHEFLRWVPDYVNNFGKFSEENVERWTVLEFLTGNLGMTLDEINSLGEQSSPEVRIDKEWVQQFKNEIRKIYAY